VSLLWRDEVAIFIAPRKIALARRERGLRSRVVSATTVTVANGHIGDIRPTVDRLAELLAEETWRDATARVVVSDLWARYAIVPWPAARIDEASRVVHARYMLGDAFGEALADWSVALSDTPPGRPYLACAMPSLLRPALEDVLTPAGLKLVSLKPQLVVGFGAWRPRLTASDAWYVSIDEGSLAAVHIVNGVWDRVHTTRLSGDWVVELERLRTFGELMRAAGAVTRMFIDAPAWMRSDRLPQGADVEWLAEDGSDAASHELALLERTYA